MGWPVHIDLGLFKDDGSFIKTGGNSEVANLHCRLWHLGRSH